MAENALFSVASRIISSLVGPLAAEEFRLSRRFKEELENLQSTVSTIKAVLLDAEEQPSMSHAVTNWVEKLTDALYEADDLLDAFCTEAQRRQVMIQDQRTKKVRLFLSKPTQPIYDLKKAHRVEAIRKRLDAIAAERKFHLDPRPVGKRVSRGRDTYSLLSEQEVIIGRENDKKAVIERLKAKVEGNVSILPIVGIGGLGKTTLAQLIYNDKAFTKTFDLKMWVCVSNDFDVEIIVKKILGSITQENPKDDSMNALVDLFSRKVNKQRYLLVLDDVWNENYGKWSQLKSLLSDGGRGSRIIVTTRTSKVANTMHSEPYILGGLREEASWQLFKQHAFENEQQPFQTSKHEIGMEVIRKCAGVPLALRTVGGLLYSKDLEFWMSFKDKELSTLPPNTEIDILTTLKLSYDKLPSHLKHCFASCSLFPKNFVYHKITLINLWIAHGFVNPQEDQCFEDIGHDYFMDLFYGSFFQDPIINDLGNITYCKMHDIMHDLATLVAGSLTGIVGDKVRNISKKTRFIGFHDHSNVSSMKQFSFNANKVQTFLCPIYSFEFLLFKGKIDCENIFSSFKSLRVLDLSSRNLKCVSSSISKLKHLRYLDLSKNESLKQLPKSITRLQNLQTLLLFHCKSLEKLPRGFASLINLRYLSLAKCDNLRHMPQGLGKLTNLQRLTHFVVDKGSHSKDCGNLKELNGLNSLRGKLKIQGLSHMRDIVVKYEAMNLKQKSRLNGLSLKWSHEDDINDFVNEMSFDGLQPSPNLKELTLCDYQGLRLPTWILSLTSLVNMKMYGCNRCQDVSLLSQLPFVKNLTLYSMNGLEYILECHDTSMFSFSSFSSFASLVFFPKLEDLTLEQCPNLKGWWKRDSFMGSESNDHITEVVSMKKNHLLLSFLSLLSLSIFNCPMLTSLPICPNLEKLILCRTSFTLVSLTNILSKLKRLDLGFIKGLETLPNEWGQSLTSLEELDVYCLDKLKFVHPIQHLTTLKHLTFRCCPKLELVIDENEVQWQGPTTLQTFHIFNCYNLTTIPKWIENCKSLEVLKIDLCSYFNSQRCKEETGEDWSKIAHIPNFIVYE